MTSLELKRIPLHKFSEATRRFPAEMWRATADGYDRAFRGAWKAFKAQLPFKTRSSGYSLVSPKAWPFEITYDPLPNAKRPNFTKFFARWGNFVGENVKKASKRDGLVAVGLEEGGTQTPKRGKWLAIPLDPARTSSGRRRKDFLSPRLARQRKGIKFIATFKGDHGLLWALEKIKIFGPMPAGRPKKRGKARLYRSREPWYLLQKRSRIPINYLGFHRTWERERPNSLRRIASSLTKGMKAAFEGRAITYHRGLKREIPY